jgi:hypothetical protein
MGGGMAGSQGQTSEIEALKAQAELLATYLEQIKQRIAEIENSEGGK